MKKERLGGGRRGKGGGKEGERRGQTRVAYQNTRAAPRLIHFEECLARRACIGLVAHVTHVRDAAEIPRGALAVHLHKIYLQEMSCTAEG